MKILSVMSEAMLLKTSNNRNLLLIIFGVLGILSLPAMSIAIDKLKPVLQLQSCKRLLKYSDAVEVLPPNIGWHERCHLCFCNGLTGLVECGMTHGKKECKTPYDASVDRVCVKWSEDGCCCLQEGCERQGRVYSWGEFYPLDKDDPCSVRCQCQALGPSLCLSERCDRIHGADLDS